MKKMLAVSAGLLLLGAALVQAERRPQPYANVPSVRVVAYRTFTTTVGGDGAFAACNWGTSNITCNSVSYGPHAVEHVVMLVKSAEAGWTFQVGCSAAWRWSHCSPLMPDYYAVKIRGTQMIFTSIIENADYTRPKSRTYKILMAIPN